MPDKIKGIGGDRGRDDKPTGWKPWEPPVSGPKAPAEQQAAAQASATTPEGPAAKLAARIAADRVGTGPLARRASSMKLDASMLPKSETGANGRTAPSSAVQDAAKAVGELGVVATLGQVAMAMAKTPFDPANIADSVGKLTDQLSQVGAQLAAIPGLGTALQELGGIGTMVSGLAGLKEEIAKAKEDGGMNLAGGIGAAASAAHLVGGLSMALAPACPALATVGAALTVAGTALKLGKMALENSEGFKNQVTQVASKTKGVLGKLFGGLGGSGGLVPATAMASAGGPSRMVNNNAANMVNNNGANMVSNNVANMVSNNVANMARGNPFGWLTGK